MKATIVDQFEPWLGFITQGWKQALEQASALEFKPGQFDRILLFGCGDSHCAALSLEMLFSVAAGVDVLALHSMHTARYIVPDMGSKTESTLAIGISASGEVARTIEALDLASERGMKTLALTCDASSKLARRANAALSLDAPSLALGPGLPSYTASLLMAMAIAFHISDAEMQNEIVAGMNDFHQTFLDWALVQAEAAEKAAYESQGTGTVFVGSGPTYGSAGYGAAKLIEIAGEYAWRQDVEEWCHLEYFCSNAGMPTYLLSSSGRSETREREMKAAADAIGRQLILSQWKCVGHPHSDVEEMLSPLALWVGPTVFSLTRAQILGEKPFRAFSGGRNRDEGGGASKVRTSLRICLEDITSQS